MSFFKKIANFARLMNEGWDEVAREEQMEWETKENAEKAEKASRCCACCEYGFIQSLTGEFCCDAIANRIAGRPVELTSSFTETEDFIYTHKCMHFKRKCD